MQLLGRGDMGFQTRLRQSRDDPQSRLLVLQGLTNVPRSPARKRSAIICVPLMLFVRFVLD